MEYVPSAYPSADAFSDQPTTPTQADLLAANTELFSHAAAIPFANRVRYLFGDSRPEGEGVPLDSIAERLGKSTCSLHSLVRDLRAPDEQYFTDENLPLQLSPVMALVVSEEHRWREEYDKTAQEVTAPQIAAMFDVTVDHIENLMHKIGIEPRITGQGTFGAANYYPKELLYRVRAEIMMFPTVHENRSSRAQVVRELGCTANWFNARIGDDADPDLMRDESSVHVDVYYAQPFTNRLRQEWAELHATAEDASTTWTKNDIAVALGRDMGWVNREIRAYTRQKITLLGKNGRPYDHYRDNVFQELQALSEKAKNTPVMQDGQATLTQLVRPLGMTETTAEPILKSLGITPIERRATTSERILNVYGIDVREALVNGLIDIRQKSYDTLVQAVDDARSGKQVTYNGKRIDLKEAKMQLGQAKKRLLAALKIGEQYRELKAA